MFTRIKYICSNDQSGGCANESSAKPFREETYKFDGTRPVTQNRHATDLSTRYLDVQGFSHKKPKDFDQFHKMYPKKPTLATECCSCLSQRGVDQDECPNPRPSGCLEGCRIDCHGNYTGNQTDGIFYNNEISQCTAVQVKKRIFKFTLACDVACACMCLCMHTRVCECRVMCVSVLTHHVGKLHRQQVFRIRHIYLVCF